MAPKNPNKAPPFTVKSEEYTQLAQMFQNGEIDKNWTPKMVWDTVSYFPKVSLGSVPCSDVQIQNYEWFDGG
jgi:hypothetical protein